MLMLSNANAKKCLCYAMLVLSNASAKQCYCEDIQKNPEKNSEETARRTQNLIYQTLFTEVESSSCSGFFTSPTTGGV